MPDDVCQQVAAILGKCLLGKASQLSGYLPCHLLRYLCT